MKKSLSLGLILVIVGLAFFLLPKKTSAIDVGQIIFSLSLPFGGQIITTALPDVTCPGQGPITITPAGLLSTGPYLISATTKSYLYGAIAPGVWILGLYSPIPVFCLFTPPPPLVPVPIPVYPIILYGSSLL